MKNRWTISKLGTQKLQVTLLIALAFFALSGCGAKNSQTSGSSDQGSLGDRGDTTTTKPAAVCNKISSGDVEARLMAYVDANGARNNSLVRLKFVRVPDDYANDGYDILIRKWTASPTGVVRPGAGEEPLYVNTLIEMKTNNSFQAMTGWNYNLKCDTCPTLEWYNMKLIAQKYNVTANSPNEFFSKFDLLLDLQDAAGDWKALQIIFVNGSTVMKTLNMLIPTFDANPGDYTPNHPPVLNNLHPFISMINQNFPTSQFQTEANGYCF